MSQRLAGRKFRLKNLENKQPLRAFFYPRIKQRHLQTRLNNHLSNLARSPIHHSLKGRIIKQHLLLQARMAPRQHGRITTLQQHLPAKMVSQERMKRQHLPFRGRMAPPCRVTKHHLRHQARTTPKRVRSRTPQCSHLPTSRRLYLTHRTGMPVKTTQCQSLTTPKNGIHLQWVTCRINL